VANEGKLASELVEVFQDQAATARLTSEFVEVFQNQTVTARFTSEFVEVFQNQTVTARFTSEFVEVFRSFLTPVANVPDITGTTGSLATFTSAASTGSLGDGTTLTNKLWSWTSVPGGSSVANITPTPMPNSGGTTFIAMTSNAALFHCEAGSGTDSSGNGNTATLSNIISGGGKVGSNSWLYNTTTAKADLTTPVSAAGSWTVACWFYNLGADGTTRSAFCDSGQSQVPLRIIASGNQLGCYFAGEVASGFTMLAANYTGWHHAVAVGSGSTTTFYIDGVLVGSVAVKQNNNFSCIGNIPFAVSERFAERLDEVAIWTRALTADEVSALYANQSGNYAGTGTTFSFTPDVTGTYTVQFSMSDSIVGGTYTDSANAVVTAPTPSTAFGSWPQEELARMTSVQGNRLKRHRGQM